MSVSELIQYYKTQTRAAESLSVSQAAVSNWRARGKIPDGQQTRIQIKTRGRLRADKGIV